MRGALEIRAVSRYRQSDNWNSCAEQNGGCTHFCFFRGDNYSCGCPDKPNGELCRTEPAFIVANKRPGDVEETTLGPTLTTDTGNQAPFIKPEIIVLTTIILAIILVIVIIVMGVMVFNSRKKRGRKSSRASSGSILTFTNPNYNVADGSGHSDSSKGTIWRRFKYDKAQVGIYFTKMILINCEHSTNISETLLHV